MPIPRETYAELIAKHEQAHRKAQRDTLWDFARTCATMIFWVLSGWVFLAFALHTTDVARGWVLYWIGLCVWIPGVLFTLLNAYRRGEQRGDW